MVLVNGGQTGVDRAVLDFAVRYDIPYTGYVCDAEDLAAKELVEKYPNLVDYGLTNVERTKKNIEMSDWLVCISDPRTVDVDSRTFTDQWVMFDAYSPTVSSDILSWYQDIDCDAKLCVGGSRESWMPGIYEKTTEVLEAFFLGVEENMNIGE